MKNNTKRYLRLSIILYIIILSVALVGTLAWFVFEKTAVISVDKDSKIVAGDYLELCLDDGDNDDSNDIWASELELDSLILQYPDVSVTPDGSVWYPVSLGPGETLLTGEANKDAYRDVTNTDYTEGYYFRLDLKVRATKGMEVYLHENSSIMADRANSGTATVVGADGEAVSFSKSAVAGASRVAFFTDEGLKTIWVPNDQYELKFDADGNVIGFNESGNPESEYKYIKMQNGFVVAGDEYGVWEDKFISNTLASGSVTDGYYTDGATPILQFTDVGVQKLSIYIWVEGSDREANTVLSGGSLKYNLQLVGIPMKAEAKVNIEDVEYVEGDLRYSSGKVAGSEILYSLDSENWTAYAENTPLLKGVDKFYIRAKETATENAGAVKEIVVS